MEFFDTVEDLGVRIIHASLGEICFVYGVLDTGEACYFHLDALCAELYVKLGGLGSPTVNFDWRSSRSYGDTDDRMILAMHSGIVSLAAQDRSVVFRRNGKIVELSARAFLEEMYPYRVSPEKIRDVLGGLIGEFRQSEKAGKSQSMSDERFDELFSDELSRFSIFP